MVIYLILKIPLWNQAWMVLFILYSHIPDEGNETQETSLNSLCVTVYPYIFFQVSFIHDTFIISYQFFHSSWSYSLYIH